MTFLDSIVAIATPNGVGGICVVRLSGTKALDIAKSITKKTSFTPRYAYLSPLYDKNNMIFDEAIVIFYAAPKSYTCEDVIEFQCHGGNIIGERITRLCMEYGARLATRGEFTKRAFLNGRIDIAQVNAISKMISTNNASYQQALALQLRGALGIFVGEVREILLSALAHSEVMIDYSEEDIPSDLLLEIDSKLESLFGRLERIYRFSSLRANTLGGIGVCIIGKPNVGKSSTLNAILLYERAITSSKAGTTRDTIEEQIIIEGNSLRLIDTAGIRDTDDLIEKEGINKAINAIDKSSIILAIFDISNRLDNEDREILNILESSKDKHIIIVLNKIDKPSKLDEKQFFGLKERKGARIIKINALNKTKTADILAKSIGEILRLEQHSGEILLSASYQLDCILKTMQALESARERLKSAELELFSYHINDALSFIGELTHPASNDEMLDKMFGEFCLGK